MGIDNCISLRFAFIHPTVSLGQGLSANGLENCRERQFIYYHLALESPDMGLEETNSWAIAKTESVSSLLGTAETCGFDFEALPQILSPEREFIWQSCLFFWAPMVC